jgi:hypothetical protein
VDTDRIVEALDPLQPAHHACSEALRHGASFTLWRDGAASPAELLEICHRRHRGVLEQGIETLGFEQALEALKTTGYGSLRLGAVDVEEPPYHYALFLAPTHTEVVACLGVDQSLQPDDS